MASESVVSKVETYLKTVKKNGIAVRFGVLFGSQAGGETHEWSDIDLIVVSPKFDEPNSLDDIGKLWRIAGRVDSRIEPIPCGEKQWLEDESHPIIEIARQKGEIINLPEV